MQIGPHQLPNIVIAAPMAGVSDKPYRQVCRQHGAGLVISEMVTSRADLRTSRKTICRLDHSGEAGPIAVQIVGAKAKQLAQAAQFNVDNGAQIIDINMGCPAKKVCRKQAGSALLENEKLVDEILSEVVAAVDVPVTLKIRTGVTPLQRNATTIAKIAEQAGIQCLTIHGRTRQCKFIGDIDYDTIARVKQQVSIPVVANGDITSPESAKRVLDHTKADAVMIGRAAQGQPWLFQQVADFLQTGHYQSEPGIDIKIQTILSHLLQLHDFYGHFTGVRVARKYIKWYLQHWHETVPIPLLQKINQTENSTTQLQLIEQFLGNNILLRAA